MYLYIYKKFELNIEIYKMHIVKKKIQKIQNITHYDI